MHPYLSKDVLRQAGSLEEGDGLGPADPAVPVQIRPPEVRLELLRARPLALRRHFANSRPRPTGGTNRGREPNPIEPSGKRCRIPERRGAGSNWPAVGRSDRGETAGGEDGFALDFGGGERESVGYRSFSLARSRAIEEGNGEERNGRRRSSCGRGQIGRAHV